MTAAAIIKRRNYHTVKSDFILAPGFNPGRRAMFLISPVCRISLRFSPRSVCFRSEFILFSARLFRYTFLSSIFRKTCAVVFTFIICIEYKVVFIDCQLTFVYLTGITKFNSLSGFWKWVEKSLTLLYCSIIILQSELFNYSMRQTL